jgi:hypothetical protein
MKKIMPRLGVLAIAFAGFLVFGTVAEASSAFNKVNLFVDDLAKGNLNLSTDTIHVILSNTAPVATNHCYTDISANELAGGDGYSTGGQTVTGTGVSNASGVETLTAGNTVWTSTTGNMGPLRYVIYVDWAPLGNASAACKPIIGWYDNGSSVTLNGTNGDTYTSAPSGGSLLQLQ